MGAEDRYDVVVVGAEAGGAVLADAVARDLAHLCAVRQTDVELALQRGEFVAFRGINGGEMATRADRLRAMKLRVKVRPSEVSLEMPVIEPDDQPAPAAEPGRFGGPVPQLATGSGNTSPGARPTGLAPPPDFAGPPASVPMDPSRPQGRLHTQAIERPFDAVDQAKTARFQPVAHSAAVMGIDDAMTNRFDAVPPEGMENIVEQLEAASTGDGAVMTLDGVSHDEALEVEAEQKRVDDPMIDSRGDSRVDSMQEARPLGDGPGPDAVLELDGAPAGPLGAVAPSPDPGASASLGALPSPSASASASMQAGDSMRAAASTSAAPTFAAPRGAGPPLREAKGLFVRDTIGNYLCAVAAMMVVCLVMAFAVTRATKKPAVLALHTEIEESFRKPLGVQAGDLRAPSVIEEDLEGLYGSARTRFLLILLLGAPLGLALGRVRI